MLEWLTSDTAAAISVQTVIVRLLTASVAGWLVSLIAKRRSDDLSDSTLSITLMLMCILIAMATQIIGDNVARAFSLVGALSIVRFRTAVSTTQDVAFVLAAVVVGMAIGAGQYYVAAIGLAIIAGASFLPISTNGARNELKGKQPESVRLTIQATLGSTNTWAEVLKRYCASYELVLAETARRGSSMIYDYRVSLFEGLQIDEAVSAFSQLPQVETVSIKKA